MKNILIVSFIAGLISCQPSTNRKYADYPISQVNLKQVELSENGYVQISRKWTANDRIELILPMKVRQVVADARVKDIIGLSSIEYGPLVYCAEEIDNEGIFDQTTVTPQTKYTVEMKPDLLGGVNVVSDGKTTFIPYYAWSNRGVGKMKVWW